MSVAAFLEELRSRDIQVWPDGDQLRCNAPAGVLTPDVRIALQERKRDIVEFLRSAEAVATQQRAIVPLQPRGSRAPVFGVPGHNGDVFLYRALTQHLGADQPFFGLEPPGLDGNSEPLRSVEDLAAYFAEQIRAFRPNGPYVIAGYCAGATIAFELARQLQQKGASISCVIMFAGAYPTWYGIIPQHWERFALRFKRLRKHAAFLASSSFREGRAYISAKLRARAEAKQQAAPDEIAALRTRLKRVIASAVHQYRPREFAGRVCQIVPSRDCVIAGDPMLLWRNEVPHMEEYYGPDGCEGDVMLLEPYASSFADVFRICRDAVAGVR